MNPLRQTPSIQTQGLASAKEYFDAENISLPYVPAEDKPKVQMLSKTIFGTRNELPSRLYDIETYVQEALKSSNNYVLFGIDGYGISSTAMHYYAVKDNLAIFIKLSVNPLSNPTAIHERINAFFGGVSQIFEFMDKAIKNHLVKDDQRLFVVMDDFKNGGWGWITGTPGKIEENVWHIEEQQSKTLIRALLDIPS